MHAQASVLDSGSAPMRVEDARKRAYGRAPQWRVCRQIAAL